MEDTGRAELKKGMRLGQPSTAELEEEEEEEALKLLPAAPSDSARSAGLPRQGPMPQLSSCPPAVTAKLTL
jgi:hypothetical protein